MYQCRGLLSYRLFEGVQEADPVMFLTEECVYSILEFDL